MAQKLPRLGMLLALASLLVSPALFAGSKSKSIDKRKTDFTKYTLISGATKIGNEQCSTCHAGLAKSFRQSAHSLRDVDCEQCHGAGSLHLEAGGYSKESKDKIISFKDRPAEEANGACLSCHAKSEHVRNWFAGAHASQGLKCADCHSIHAENATLESRRQQNDRCLECHRKQEAQGSLPYHHPIREGKMSCNDCHDPHGGSGGNNLKLANGNQLCFRCHSEYQGPFSYQHPPVNEDCLKCHSPHGSPNQSLLTVSQPALCLQCHSAHHNGANLPLVGRCTDCHNAVHGSDVASATGGSKFIDK